MRDLSGRKARSARSAFACFCCALLSGVSVRASAQQAQYMQMPDLSVAPAPRAEEPGNMHPGSSSAQEKPLGLPYMSESDGAARPPLRPTGAASAAPPSFVPGTEGATHPAAGNQAVPPAPSVTFPPTSGTAPVFPEGAPVQAGQVAPMGQIPVQAGQVVPMGQIPAQAGQVAPIGQIPVQAGQVVPMGQIPVQAGQVVPMGQIPAQPGQDPAAPDANAGPETLSLQGQSLDVPGLPETGRPTAAATQADMPLGVVLTKPPLGPNPDPTSGLKKKSKESDISDAYKFRPETSPANTKQYSVQNLHLPQVQYESEYIRLFFDAVAADDMDAVRALYSYFKTPEFRDDHMNTPLIYSVMTGKKRMTETLLGMGANPNNYNAYRVTPLMVAAKSGRADLLNLLLHFNAMPNTADRHGHTALMYAASANAAECVMLLAKYGADTDAARFSDSSSALHLAVHYNAPQAVEMLLKHGADPDILNTHRITPLMLAANYNFGDVASILLRYHANPQLVDRKGRTAENFAWSRKFFVLAKTLSHYRLEALDRSRRGLPDPKTPGEVTPSPWESGYSPYEDPRYAKQYNPLAPRPIPQAPTEADGFSGGYARAPQNGERPQSSPTEPEKSAAPKAEASKPAAPAKAPAAAKPAPKEPVKTAEDTGYESEDTAPRPFPEVELKPHVPSPEAQANAPASAGTQAAQATQNPPALGTAAAPFVQPAIPALEPPGMAASRSAAQPGSVVIPSAPEDGVPSVESDPKLTPELAIPGTYSPQRTGGQSGGQDPARTDKEVMHGSQQEGAKQEDHSPPPARVEKKHEEPKARRHTEAEPAAPASKTPPEPKGGATAAEDQAEKEMLSIPELNAPEGAPTESANEQRHGNANGHTPDAPTPGVRIPADPAAQPSEGGASKEKEAQRPAAPKDAAASPSPLSVPSAPHASSDGIAPNDEDPNDDDPTSPGGGKKGKDEPKPRAEESLEDMLIAPTGGEDEADKEAMTTPPSERAAADRRRKDAEDRRKAAEARQQAIEKRRSTPSSSEENPVESPPESPSGSPPAEEEEPVNVSPAPKPEANLETQELSGTETDEMRRILESLESEEPPPKRPRKRNPHALAEDAPPPGRRQGAPPGDSAPPDAAPPNPTEIPLSPSSP